MRHVAAVHPAVDAPMSGARWLRPRAVLAWRLSGSSNLVLCCAAATLVGALLTVTNFPAGGNDDSHITYWAAHALASLGRVVNYNGEVVEQSSSLALVVLLAGVEKALGVPPPAAGWFIGISSAALAIVLAALIGTRVAPKGSAWVPFLLGTWLPFLYWSTSGMEMTLTALLGCAVVASCGSLLDESEKSPHKAWLAALFSLLGFALVRPETPIVLVCMLAFAVTVHAIEGWRGGKKALDLLKSRASILFVAGTLIALSLLAVRLSFFGMPFPNSASAKVGGFALAHGAAYFFRGIASSGPFVALAALAGIPAALVGLRSRGVSNHAALLVGLTVATAAFVLGSGGDWMPGARLLVPLGPPIAILAASLIGWVTERRWLLGLAIGIPLLVLNVRSVFSFGSSKLNGSYSGAKALDGSRYMTGFERPEFHFSELANKAHRRDARLLGALLDVVERLDPKPERPIYIMSGQAGMVPYHVFREHYGAARFIDLFAITSPNLVTCVPRRAQTPQIHGVRLSPDWIIRHADEMEERCGVGRPDIVFSNGRFPKYLRRHGYVKVYQGPPSMEAFVALDGRHRSLVDAK